MNGMPYNIDGWNAAVPVGTPVRYWSGYREGEGKTSRTRTTAELLGGHTAVVWLEDVAGCVSLTHVETVDTDLLMTEGSL
ncbi:hypothetical protein GCM10010412_099140 [Nonomuraea recticatena]|uniref:Uncharacterized protein n=1 Tax=Nonomuraea recticatena TaxID=46178 RepID=A0ABN3TGC1_9ACTN